MNTLYSHSQAFQSEIGNPKRDCTMCGVDCTQNCVDVYSTVTPNICYYSCEAICSENCATNCKSDCTGTCYAACGNFCHHLIF